LTHLKANFETRFRLHDNVSESRAAWGQQHQSMSASMGDVTNPYGCSSNFAAYSATTDGSGASLSILREREKRNNTEGCVCGLDSCVSTRVHGSCLLLMTDERERAVCLILLVIDCVWYLEQTENRV
jgi:hypothetical protein